MSRAPDRLVVMLVATATATGACGARQAPAPPEDEAAIAPVVLVGADGVDADALRDGLGLTQARAAGRGFDPYLVRLDAERIRGFYLRRGFFDVAVEPVVDERPDRVQVTYRIAEGPRADLARVDVLGAPADGVSAPALRALVPLRDGEPFFYDAYEEALPALRAALGRAGYCRGEVEGQVVADPARRRAIVRIQVTAGPRCTYGDVAIEGVDGALADAVRARVARRVAPGERFDSGELAEVQAELYDMGRFASVRIEAVRDGEGAVVPVRIAVVEGTRNELRVGAGAGVDPATYEVRARAGYRIAGWPTPLTTTRLELRPAYEIVRDLDRRAPRLEAIAGIERIDLLRPMVTGEAQASLEYLTVEAYTSVGPRVRLGLRSPLGRRELQLAVGWELAVLDFRRLDPALSEPVIDELGLDEAYRLGFFEQALLLDLRDDPLSPRRGWYGELRAEEGTIAAGGMFDYVKLTPELRGYVPVGDVVLAGRARAGAILGDQPVTQLYLLGGASSHRGFSWRRLAPYATNVVDGELRSVPIGGGAMFETSVEARIPVGTVRGLDLGATVFLDGGDVTPELDDLDLGDLHWATGVGVRVDTLVGPIRFDLAYRLTRSDDPWLDTGRLVYHFGLGEAF